MRLGVLLLIALLTTGCALDLVFMGVQTGVEGALWIHDAVKNPGPVDPCKDEKIQCR